jgi:outer membrane protein assembly factor BamD (BamD/ComL family)
LIEAARGALARDPERALALVAEHQRRFPDGALAQEREVVAVTALVATGQTDRARARAQRFSHAYPDSTYLPRLRQIVSDGDGTR